MHELSICQNLLVQVADIAAARGASSVVRITLEVGPLCGVEPTLLARAFEVARAGSCAASAELNIEIVGVSVRCVPCGAETQVMANRMLCGSCGGYRTELISGDEMRLRAVELQLPEPMALVSA